jgi:SnoaL-like domain
MGERNIVPDTRVIEGLDDTPKEGLAMSALDVVNAYYEACNDGGDLSGVPLADDVTFSGPLAIVEGAANFRAHTAQWGDIKCTIREQFVNGDRVCSVVDWTMTWPVSSLTTTEILQVRNGEIVSGEVIFDPNGFATPSRKLSRGPRSTPPVRACRC